MSKLVGLDGKPLLTRQQQRQVDRKNTRHTATTMNELQQKSSMLFFRTEVLMELLKSMGATDEQIAAAEEKVINQFNMTKVQVQK